MQQELSGYYTAKIAFIPRDTTVGPASILLEVSPEQYSRGGSERLQYSLLEIASSVIESSKDLPTSDPLYNYYQSLREATTVPHQVTIDFL